MVTFEVGKYYVYKGPTEDVPDDWNIRMAFVFDGEPHRVLHVGLRNYVVAFEPPDGEDIQSWNWSENLEYWEEYIPVDKEPEEFSTKILFKRSKHGFRLR